MGPEVGGEVNPNNEQIDIVTSMSEVCSSCCMPSLQLPVALKSQSRLFWGFFAIGTRSYLKKLRFKISIIWRKWEKMTLHD